LDDSLDSMTATWRYNEKGSRAWIMRLPDPTDKICFPRMGIF